MSLIGKLEGDLDIKTAADKFHDFYSKTPHHVANITPNYLQSCDLHEGEYGSPGSVINWNYCHDGKIYPMKELIVAIDDEKKSVTSKVIEGDLLKQYKMMKITVHATPKESGGSVVTWTIEYEKLHADLPDPHMSMEFAFNITRDIDAHLQDQA